MEEERLSQKKTEKKWNYNDNTETISEEMPDEILEYISMLSKLQLTETEKEQAKKDLFQMQTYMDRMQQLDTKNVVPLNHFTFLTNVFREDEVTNTDERDQILSMAPKVKGDLFEVPKTFE